MPKRKSKSSWEERLLADYEAGKLVSVGTPEELEKFRRAARATVLKDCRVNIRLSSSVLAGLRTRAAEEGLPYQSLIASILHKYVSGRLAEGRPSARARERPVRQAKRVKTAR